jgi:tetratricopeptide (TPR) repeat protein
MRAESATLALPFLEQALKLDTTYAAAHAAMAWCYHCKFSRGAQRSEDRTFALFHARSAVANGRDDAASLAIAGLVIWFDEGDLKGALDLFDRALKLSPSSIFALCCSALPLAWMGETVLSIKRARRAIHLSPFDPLNCLAYDALAISYLHTEQYAEALDAARRAAEVNPSFSMPRLFEAAALVRLGHLDEARIVARYAELLDPSFSVQKYSVAMGRVPGVFNPIAEAWGTAGLSAD